MMQRSEEEMRPLTGKRGKGRECLALGKSRLHGERYGNQRGGHYPNTMYAVNRVSNPPKENRDGPLSDTQTLRKLVSSGPSAHTSRKQTAQSNRSRVHCDNTPLFPPQQLPHSPRESHRLQLQSKTGKLPSHPPSIHVRVR